MNHRLGSWRIGAALVAIIMATVGLVSPASRANAATTCSSLVVIGARGSGEPYKAEESGMGPANFLAFRKIQDRVPDAQPYGLPYEAVAVDNDTANVITSSYWNSVGVGTVILRNYVEELIANCPYQRIAFLGYSQGAHVIGDLLATWGQNANILAHIAAVLFFGDPRFNPTAPFDQGSFNHALEGAFYARTVASVWWNKIRSYCTNQDFICNWSVSNLAACPDPGHTNPPCGHFSYGTSGQADAGGIWLGNLAAALPPLAGPPPPPVWGGIGASPTFLGSNNGTLQSNWVLFSNQYILSDDARFALLLQTDGNLVLYGGGSIWQSNTAGSGVNRLVMQADGNLVLYRPNNTWVWQSGTSGTGPSHLSLQTDGNLVVYRDSGGFTWQTGTGGHTGTTPVNGDALWANQQLNASSQQYLRSPDKRYALLLQSDGNLILYGPGYHLLWQSGTGGTGITRLVMQSDGNLTLYNVNTPVWWTGTNGAGLSHLILQNDGNLVIYKDSGGYTWQTVTSGRL